MKRTVINEKWEEILIDDESYFYAIIYAHNVERAKYVKSYGTSYEQISGEYHDFVNQLKDSEDKRYTIYFVKLPNTEKAAELLEKALYKGEDKSPKIVEAVDQLLSRQDLEILETWAVHSELTEAKKKKRKPRKIFGGYLCWTTGCPIYNMNEFNKHMDTNFTPEKDINKEAEHAADEANSAIDGGDAGSVSGGESSGANEISSMDSAGEGGSMGESLKLNEAKRYVKRYYVRPQNIFCSNKEEILKALVQVGDNNCSVYSLKSLPDHDDVHLLKPSDIIYYYDDGILYDKNHVKVMDYDLFVKHEEERRKVGNVNTMSDAAFADEYDDRLTDADLKDKEIKVRKATHEDLNEAVSLKDLKVALFMGEAMYLGYNMINADKAHNFSDGGVYAGTSYYVELTDNGYEVYAFDTSDDGAEEDTDITYTFGSFEELCDWIKEAKLNDNQVLESLKEDTIYVGKLGGTLNLPPQIKLLDQDLIEWVVDYLEPEEEFEVGYVNPIYLYKELWEHLPIYKCTEMRGYTGVDFAQSKDIINNDQETRIATAKDEIKKAKDAGTTFQVGSDVNYRTQNKLVARSDEIDSQTNVKVERNTILFYPTAVLSVCYYVKLPTRTDFIKINAEQLEQYIYDNLDKIQRKMDPEKVNKKIRTTLYGETDIAIDRATRTGDPLDPKHIYKYGRDKIQVRALYTSQIYHLKVDGKDYGQAIRESYEKKDLAEEAFSQNFKSVNGLGEEYDDVFTCCICGEESTGYGNNPEPVRHGGRCCDACNRKFVIPARIMALRAKDDEVKESLEEEVSSKFELTHKLPWIIRKELLQVTSEGRKLDNILKNDDLILDAYDLLDKIIDDYEWVYKDKSDTEAIIIRKVMEKILNDLKTKTWREFTGGRTIREIILDELKSHFVTLDGEEVKDIPLTEASSLTPYEKMDLFNKGQRRENVKACGDQKLFDYRRICQQYGFTSALRQIEAEMISRGLINPQPAQQPKPQPQKEQIVLTPTDFHTADALFIRDNQDTNTIIKNAMATTGSIKHAIISLIWSLCLKLPKEIIDALRDFLNFNCGISKEELQQIIKNCLANKDIVDRLNTIVKDITTY